MIKNPHIVSIAHPGLESAHMKKLSNAAEWGLVEISVESPHILSTIISPMATINSILTGGNDTCRLPLI